MNGFLHYFMSVLDPMSNAGFSRALIELLASGPPAWLLIGVLPFVIIMLPGIAIWFIDLVRPKWIRPPLPVRQPQPLVSVVIAGRNESATIGECIRNALTCGYPNLEVIFVDDHSEDNSVAVARRAALSVTGSRHDTERIRIFPSPRRNGKASSLNIGIRMVRGEFIVVHDADSMIPYGTMQHWLLPFADPRVGGVCGNIRVNNSTVNLLTRLQEIEYALKFTIGRYIQAKLNILNVITGMGGIFRAEIFRRLGGYDTGLGDDTDMTAMLRKQRWRLDFSLGAVVWTTVPETRDHLWRQRERWRRNLIKVRISKHRDMFVPWRYGFANTVVMVTVLMRILVPAIGLVALMWAAVVNGPLETPEILATAYWIILLFLLVRILIAREISNTPKFKYFPLILVYPFYMLWLQLILLYSECSELARIGTKHPYVPDHVWEEIPWW